MYSFTFTFHSSCSFGPLSCLHIPSVSLTQSLQLWSHFSFPMSICFCVIHHFFIISLYNYLISPFLNSSLDFLGMLLCVSVKKVTFTYGLVGSLVTVWICAIWEGNRSLSFFQSLPLSLNFCIFLVCIISALLLLNSICFLNFIFSNYEFAKVMLTSFML